MILKRSVQSAPPAAVVGSSGWRDATVRSILRAGDVVRQTAFDRLHSSTRYSSLTFIHRLPELRAHSVNGGVEGEHNVRDSENKEEFRPKSTGSMFTLLGLRDQSALVSTGLVRDYMRGVRELESYLRKQAGRVTQEGTKVAHQRERLEKLLRSLRKALLVNQQSADGRTFRPATTETIRDGADDFLCSERRGLNVLKEELESLLRKTLIQQKVLAESSKQLLDCAAERSRVTDLLPQHGSLSAGVKTYLSPLSLKPDPAGPFTPESKKALDSSSTVIRESQQLRENIAQVMSDVSRKQKDLHRSASEALLKKISETINLEQHLTLSSAATRQAIYRKQRQMQCTNYSLGKVMGPDCSADLFCRERFIRPMTQLYSRHSRPELPESDLLTQGGSVLRKHLESSGKEMAALQVAHQQLEDDIYGKHAAASVDSAVVRLRRRFIHPIYIRPATS